MNDQKAEFIHAAGGLLWRESPQGRQILIIHRQRYDDWSLPKGKLESGERWEEAALREIKEETFYEAKIDSLAGVTTYMHGKRPKVVLFWNMTPISLTKPSPSLPEAKIEVDEARWASIEEAIKRLNYNSEVTLVRQNMNAIWRNREST
jgi:8-oxo-dGTP diphosphatase